MFFSSERFYLFRVRFLSRISPRLATIELYKKCFGKKPDLKKPKFFCEKLHYLKLNDYYNSPLVTACIDKYEVKNFMKCLGKEDMCPKLYGVYNRPEEIEWRKFPKQFIVKCTHGCGYNIVCRDKKMFQTRKATCQLRKWMKEDYWVKYAETQYRFIQKRIIVEEYLGDELLTYRICCFNGIPRMIYLMSEDEKYVDYYNIQWEHLNFIWDGKKNADQIQEKPEHLEQLVKCAQELCKGFPFVRIDLYDVNGKIYLSEFTFMPGGGIMKFQEKRTSRILGNWLKI